MTYPRTPEEKARSLGSRLACEAFNACGSLDAKKCQEVGDAFGKAIAELVADTWEAGRIALNVENYGPSAGTAWTEFDRCVDDADRAVRESFLVAVLADGPMRAPLSPESRAALAAGLESARRGEIRPLDLSWMPPVELGDFDDQ